MKPGAFQKFCQRIDIFSFTDYRAYMKKVFELIKTETREPWSYDHYSQLLGLGKGSASFLMINGQRNPSEQSIKSITKQMGLIKESRRYFKAMVEFQAAQNDKDREVAFKKIIKLRTATLSSQIDKVKMGFFSDWHYSAIYELLSIPESKDDPEWIAKIIRPRISAKKISSALQELVEMGFLERHSEWGRLAPSQVALATGAEARGVVFISYHQMMIQLALNALINGNPYEPNFTSVTVTLSSDEYKNAVKLTEEYHQKLIELSDNSKAKEQVFQVNNQIFPLTVPFIKSSSKE